MEKKKKKKKLDNNIFRKKDNFNPRHNFNIFFPISNKIKQQQD